VANHGAVVDSVTFGRCGTWNRDPSGTVASLFGWLYPCVSMQLSDALDILRSHEAEFRTMGVRSLFIFGSTARNQARPTSDVDLLVEFDGPATLDRYMTLKERLEALLQARVDLVTTRGLKPRLKAVIDREAVLVA
jgi:predicted nucleotidyltransferase